MNCPANTSKSQITTNAAIAMANDMAKAQAEVIKLRDQGALFVVSHSGGKDSQAMFILVSKLVPKEQIYVIYALLAEVVFDGTESHARNTTQGFQFKTVTHSKGATLLTLAAKRGKWPSPEIRSCTSSLKTGPIEKEIRAELKRRGLSIVVSCIGLRAEESPARSKQLVFKRGDERQCIADKTLKSGQVKRGRDWYVWLPIFDHTESDVFGAIRDAGQLPHWAYSKGMTRLSCCFCIMASKADLKVAAQLVPDLYSKYVALEIQMDQTLLMPKGGKRQFLPEITGIEPNQTQTKEIK